MGRKLLKTVQTITTFRNPLADPVGTRRGPPLVRGPNSRQAKKIFTYCQDSRKIEYLVKLVLCILYSYCGGVLLLFSHVSSLCSTSYTLCTTSCFIT